jgi:hypothetical protein
VRTDASIAGFAKIAIHAKHLEAFGITMFMKPVINAGRSLDLVLSKHVSIIVDVVQGQEQGFGFSATGALITTIMLESEILVLLS